MAGLYRNVRNHSAVTAAADNGRLRMGGTLFTPVSPGTFMNGTTRLVLDGGKLRLDDGTLLEKVEPVSPTPAELQSFTGDYVSDEAMATLRVAVEGEQLRLQNRPGSWIPLRPTYRDAFAAPGLGVVRFLRDASGRITEASVTQERVWDLRFKKRAASAF
jgi:hypothetical protein